MGRADTAPTDCAPCLFWQAGMGRAAGSCVGNGAASCRPHIACTLRLNAPPDVSAAAASSSLQVWASVVSDLQSHNTRQSSAAEANADILGLEASSCLQVDLLPRPSTQKQGPPFAYNTSRPDHLQVVATSMR